MKKTQISTEKKLRWAQIKKSCFVFGIIIVGTIFGLTINSYSFSGVSSFEGNSESLNMPVYPNREISLAIGVIGNEVIY